MSISRQDRLKTSPLLVVVPGLPNALIANKFHFSDTNLRKSSPTLSQAKNMTPEVKNGIKERLKPSFSIFRCYSMEEVLIALFTNDNPKIDEIRAVHIKFRSAQVQIENIIDNGSDDDIHMAIRTFKPPEK